MADTAQPMAAETDPYANAAQAFKAYDEPPPERPRDENGRFASVEEPDPEPEETGEDEDAADPEAAEPEDVEDTDEEEAQPEGPDMPSSWSAEDAQLWNELPVEARTKIVERETQRDRAVNDKFQEAANARKAGEAEFAAAQAARQEALVAINQTMSLMVPQEPSVSMLDRNSHDYDPDRYHMMRANYDAQMQQMAALDQQRQMIAQQYQSEQEAAQLARVQEIEQTARPKFFEAVPEAQDPEKLQPLLHSLIEYGVEHGAPPEFFDDKTTAVEWLMLWKAREYDRIKSASGKVRQTPPPQPQKAAPAVRPGVTTPRSTIQKRQADKAFARLSKTGSIEDGAAVFKNLFKG